MSGTVSRTVKVGSLDMPMIGFGTYMIKDEDCEEPVKWALEAGYKHIDTAQFYANHRAIGNAIQASGIGREELFITDKVSPNGFFGMPPTTPEAILDAIRSSLEKLQTSYVDLILLHHPFPPKEHRVSQYKALMEAQKLGLVREIGVSNYSQRHIEELIEAGCPAPAANQVELHPLNTLEKNGLITYLKSINCVPIAYSSLAPSSEWRKLQPSSSSKDTESAEHSSHLDVLEELKTKYDVSDGTLLLRWAIQHGYPILPKSCRKERIVSNFTSPFELEISPEDLLKLDQLDRELAFAWPVGNPMDAP